MKYRETIGMASVEYEGTPQEIHALLSLIEGESKAQKEIASCSDVNIQRGSAVICVSKEVAERIKDAENAISELKGATSDPTADVQNNTFRDFVMRGLAREVNRESPEMYVKGGRADEDWRLTLESSIHFNNAINESVVEGLKSIEKALLSGQTIV